MTADDRGGGKGGFGVDIRCIPLITDARFAHE